jgi:uncharacterized protein (DUF302 family)
MIMTTVSYGYTKVLDAVDFDDAEQRVTDALKAEGFGVLTEIDVRATLKKKIDVDFGRQYKILGACNPTLAHKALSAEPLIGLLLPCNVVVCEEGDKVAVSIVDPREMFKVVDNPALEEIAGEVDAKLRNVLERL